MCIRTAAWLARGPSRWSRDRGRQPGRFETQRIGERPQDQGEGGEDHEVEQAEQEPGLEVADLAADAFPAFPEAT